MDTQEQPEVVNLTPGESSRVEDSKNLEYSITRHMSFNVDCKTPE